MASTTRGHEGKRSFAHRHPRAVAAGTGLVIASALVATGASAALAAGVPGSPGYLAAADSYAVLGGSTVTNTGAPTQVWGDVGVAPGTQITGFQTNQIGGSQHRADTSARNAQTSLTDAYGAAAGATPSDSIDHATIGNQTFGPGVYRATSSMDLTGTVTLDGHGDATKSWVFQAGSTLTTATASRVVVVNGNPCNVFWQVGSSATIQASSVFVGTVLSRTSITAVTNAAIVGRLLARSGAVTLDSNRITRPVCSLTDASGTTIPVSSPTPSPSVSGSATPAPSASATASTPVAGTTPTPGASTAPRPTPSASRTPGTTPSATASPAPGVPTSGSTGGSGVLATTGSDVSPLLSLAAGLLGLGGALVAVPALRRTARRRSAARS